MRTSCGLTKGRCIWAAITSCLLLVLGCGSKEAPPAPPTAATTTRPLFKDVVEWDDFPARLDSPQFANVSARVGGIVEQAPFAEGTLVTKGDLLFVIDERPFVADLKSKDADLARASALLAQAEARAKRYESLKGSRAISAEDYDEVRATLSQAKANVAVAQAARDVSKLNLEWTCVLAPISGRVSKKYVTEGNLISAGNGQGNTLTTITSVDPLFVTAAIPERAFVEYQRFAATENGASKDPPPCFVRLESEATFDRKGQLNFFDNRVDPATGTVEIRCTLPNPDGKLLPGLFARVRIPGSGAHQALLIPDISVAVDQSSKYVLTVNAENTVERKAIELGAQLGSFRIVKSGLTKDDRLVTAGIQQLRPGTKVDPKDQAISEQSLAPFLVPPSNSPALNATPIAINPTAITGTPR